MYTHLYDFILIFTNSIRFYAHYFYDLIHISKSVEKFRQKALKIVEIQAFKQLNSPKGLKNRYLPSELAEFSVFFSKNELEKTFAQKVLKIVEIQRPFQFLLAFKK